MNKRGIISVISLLFVITFVLIVATFSVNNSSAIIQKENYVLGEKVKINLQGKENYELKIKTPSSIILKEGSNNVLSLKPAEEGKYKITLKYGNIEENYEFNVGQVQEEVPVGEETVIEEDFVEVIEENDIKIDSKEHFSLNQEPTFRIYKEKTFEEESLLEKISNLGMSQKISHQNSVIKDAYGIVIESEFVVTENDEYIEIKIPKKREFSPGKYILSTTIIDENKEITINQNFEWGVLAINFDKSIYLPSEEASISMGVLDEVGKMVCDASVVLEIKSPDGTITSLTTSDGIKISDECKKSGVTNLPDYYTRYKTSSIGKYEVKLTAVTNNGEKTILDSFEVHEKVAFDVQRLGPTRLYPVVPYTMQINIKANENYQGLVKEYVPASFEITPQGDMIISREGDAKVLSWNKNLVQGEEYQIEYQFDAPDKSPDFFLLGELEIGSFKELRNWQLANDVVFVGEFYLFWNGTSNEPSGWQCVSCASNQPFFNRFVRGFSSYGTTNGSSTHNHTTAMVSLGAGAGVSLDTAAVTIASGAHTHATNYSSITSAFNVPAHQTLKVIKYNSTGIPSVIPAGAIAIFNSTSLPANWTQYNASNNRFPFANSTANVYSGSNNHTHNVTVSLGASTETVAGRTGGTTASTANAVHSHLNASALTTVTDNTPPFIGVVFGQAMANVSLPYSSWASAGLIAMFNASAPAGWTTVSGAGGAFFERFPMGNATYGGIGGLQNHSHSNLAITSPATTTVGDRRVGVAVTGSTAAHTHVVTMNFTNASNLPLYINVIFAFAASDFEPPNVTLNAPANGFSTSNPLVTFNASIFDNTNVANVSLYGNWTGTFTLNQTNSSGLNGINYIFTQTIPDGTYSWGIQACDLSSNCNFSANRTITIDATPPTITIYSPQATNLSQSSVLFNISLSEQGSTAMYSLDGGLNNNSMSSVGNIYWNATNSSVPDGQYTVTFYANDTPGNRGSTTRNFVVDTIRPLLTIVHPQNISYNISQLSLNFSVSDINLQSCWYSNNSGTTNFTLPNCANITYGATQGSTTLRVYANDSAGNINNSQSVTFFVDSLAPSVSFVDPTRPNGTTWEFSYIIANVSITETNFANITFELYNNTNGMTLVNRTTYTSLTTLINWSNLNNNNIIYYFNATVRDVIGNINSTETRTLTLTPGDVQAPVVTIHSPSPEGVHLSQSSVLFNVSLDEIGGAVRYTLNSGITNFSMSTLNNINYNATNSSIADGNYTVRFYANDTAGNAGSIERNFTIDTIYPVINYASNSEVNATNLSRNNIFINVTVVEINFNSVTFTLYNATSLVNSTPYTDGTLFVNFTNLPNGQYTYNVTAYDEAGNSNTTVTRTATIDTLFPLIDYAVGTATNASNLSQTFVFVNVSVTEANFRNITYEIFNATSLVNRTTYTTLINTINWTNLPNSRYIYNVTIFDIAGNQNTTSTRTITLDTIVPLIDYGVGTATNASNLSQTFVFVNVSVTEANEVNITFRLFNLTALVNETIYSPGQRVINWTSLPNTDYTYNVTVFDYASNSNTTQTRTIRLDTTSPTLNNVTDTPDPVIKGTNITIIANATDNLGIRAVWVEINSTNYTLLFNTGNLYNVSINTSSLNFGFYTYIVYANDTAGNLAIALNSTFKVVNETTSPVINAINDTPDPVSFGRIFNITANVTDNTGVNSVWVEINGLNYSLAFQSGNTYNISIDTFNIGVGFFNYTVYANDSDNNLATPSRSNITIAEGDFVSIISVKAANPDPIDWDRSGRYAVIIFNPTEHNLTISEVFVNATTAAGAVWASLAQGAGSSFPTTGWTLSNNELASWSGTHTLNAGESIGFWVTLTSNKVGETFVVRYQAVVNGSLVNDPHTHDTTQFAANGNPFAQLALIEGATNPTYNVSMKGGVSKSFNVTLEEPTGRGTIASNVQLTVEVPEGFTNIISNGGTGWGNATITGNTIVVNTTQTLSSASLFYSFNATAPGGTASQGLYVLQATMLGSNANAELEGAIKVFDGEVPEITLLVPVNGFNFTTFTISPFNYTVNDTSTLTSCELFGNWTGTFTLNQSVSIPARNTINNFSAISVLTDGFYIWNVQCTDVFGNTGFAATNFTFGSFLFPNSPVLHNISQNRNDGTGNVTLFWNHTGHALTYRVYVNSSLSGTFSLLGETSSTNITDTSFSGNIRRFYRVDAINPTGQNLSSQYFGAHVYSLSHTTNTKNWIAFPSNASYLVTANQSLYEIRNATAFTYWNETNQRRVTCNPFSCPISPSCTDTNCNFELSRSRGYEVNVNSSVPATINWSLVGMVYTPATIALNKNTTNFGKNWVALYANSSLLTAANLLTNISTADAVTNWNALTQLSQGLIRSPFGSGFLGTNFTLVMEKGYEVSVNASVNWTQV